MLSITYQLQDDGILYSLSGDISALVRGKGKNTVGIEFWDENANITPILTGDLQRDTFRARLITLAGEQFGEANGLAEELNWIASNFHKHVKEREEAAAEHYESTNAEELRGSPYCATGSGFARVRHTPQGEVIEPLTNFMAKIVRDVTEDDGAEKIRLFGLEAELHGKVHSFEVPAAHFVGMNWVHEHLGAAAVVYPSVAAKDHARTAIQTFSGIPPTETVYGHTGWREVEGRPVYLHAGGAIGAHPEQKPDHRGQVWSGKENETDHEKRHTYSDNTQNGQVGQVSNIRVGLHSTNVLRELPKPPISDDRKKSIRASMGVLDLAKDSFVIPLFSAGYRAPLGESDFSVHGSGPTGEGKSEAASLIQQHYGAGLDARHLASWEATENALEMQAFTLKDQVFIVDDFNPVGSSYDVQRWHKKADRLLRAKGNSAGRQRLRSDLTLRPDKPPRALILSTGEDNPSGQSLRARVLIIELGKNELKFDILTKCQKDAAAGLYASAMAGYVEFLARRYPDLKQRLESERDKLRDYARAQGQHRRTTAIVADLALGLVYFLRYALDAEAINQEEAMRLWKRGWTTLCAVGEEQGEHQKASEPTARFSELLRAGIAGGQAHVADPTADDNVPPDARGWGWMYESSGDHERWQPKGTRLGWIREDGLYLQPDAALKLAKEIGRDSSDPVTLTKTTLGKRMRDKGLLLSTGADEGRESIMVRRKFEGRRDAYIHVSKDYLSPGLEKPDQPDHKPGFADKQAEQVWSEINYEPDHSAVQAEESDHKPDHRGGRPRLQEVDNDWGEV
jgi:hypothetical protein